MRPSHDEVWERLRLLAQPQGQIAAPTRKMAWQYVAAPQALLNACRAALREPASRLLFEAWQQAQEAVVARFARHYYHEDPTYHGCGVQVERLLCAVRGTLGAALAIQAARQEDVPRFQNWAHLSAAAWLGTAPSPESIEARSPSTGALPRLEEHFKGLVRLAPERWRIAPVRDCVRYLLDMGPRPAVRRRKVPLLGHKGQRGLVVWLYVELVEDGTGELYPDPTRMGLVPMTGAFLQAVDVAWGVAGRQSTSPQCDEPLSDGLGARDVRWWVEGRDLLVFDGPSLGLAATVALTQLLRNGPLDPQCAMTGAIDAAGNVSSVGWVEHKVAAAWAERDARDAPRIARVIVPREDAVSARNGAPGVEDVHAVATVAEAIPIASGLLGEVCRLLACQVRGIEEECRRRTGRELSEQFVPLRAARGPRPRLRPEQYGLESAPSEEVAPEEVQRPALAWEQARANARRAVVLGGPGQGKTMLLWSETRRRCLDELEKALTQQSGPDDLVAVVFERTAELAAALAEQPQAVLAEVLIGRVAAWAGLAQQTKDWLNEQLVSGQFFLALDSLEEVPAKVRPRLLGALGEFVRDYPDVGLLLSSRAANAQGPALALPDVEQLELLGLDDGQINEAVQRWCGRGERGAELLKHLRGQPLLRQALSSPLLLRLACQAAEGAARAGRALRPWRRPAELYADFVENAVAVWVERSHQRPTRLQQGQFAAFATSVAWHLWKGSPEAAVFSLEQLATAVGRALRRHPDYQARADPIEDLCAAGLIVPAGEDVPGAPYLFTHRAVQEHLVARFLARRTDWLGPLLNHVYEDAWQTVLQLLGGALDGARAAELVKALLQKNKDDLLCRPFRLAVLVAVNADDRFPAELREGLARRAVALHLCPPGWLTPEHFLAPVLACGALAVGPLLECLREGRGAVGAAGALGALQARDALRPLLGLLREGAKPLRVAAAAALGALQEREAVPALLGRLDDAEDAVRLTAAAALGALQADEAIEHLVRRLEKGRWWEGEAAAAALGALQAVEAVSALVRALDTGHDLVREAAAKALGALGTEGPEQTKALLRWLGNGSASVRAAAAQALGALRVAEALPALLRALEDTIEPVRTAAAQALGVLHAPGTEELLRARLVGGPAPRRAAAATALAVLQAREAVPALLALLRGEDEERVAAAAALGALQAREAWAELVELFDDTNEEGVLAAVRAVELLQARQAVPALLLLLEEHSGRVAEAAVRAVEALQVWQAAPLLRRLLADRYEYVQAAAATALGTLHVRDAAPDLLRLLDHGGRLVRVAAAEALGQLEGRGRAVGIGEAPTAVQEWMEEMQAGLEGEMK